VPPPLPERYRLEVRLGRDGDIEEWLASDTSLDRPVLVRVLGPDASDPRHRAFIEAVRAASAVNHPHLASVFTASEIPDGAFSVGEWAGGMTLADRLAAGETIDVDEFLPNAAGLADALAALHSEGAVHGAIDASAVFYAVDHPAKLGAFGRVPDTTTAGDDVASLARVLERALTGSAPGGPPPSELVDGISSAVDDALRSAQRGRFTARRLADALRAAPSPPPPPTPRPGWSRRLLLVAVLLVVLAAGLVGLGRLFLVGTSTVPSVTTAATDAATSSVPDVVDVTVLDISALDPYGDGSENDRLVPALVDGDPETAWETEHYRDPLPEVKQGVGVRFRLEESPGGIVVLGMSPGTGFDIGWAPENAGVWEVVASGRATGERIALQLPVREAGTWRLWLTDLPSPDGEDRYAEVSEVRFLP
jgi:serine/threonine protein kinase